MTVYDMGSPILSEHEATLLEIRKRCIPLFTVHANQALDQTIHNGSSCHEPEQIHTSWAVKQPQQAQYLYLGPALEPPLVHRQNGMRLVSLASVDCHQVNRLAGDNAAARSLDVATD